MVEIQPALLALASSRAGGITEYSSVPEEAYAQLIARWADPMGLDAGVLLQVCSGAGVREQFLRLAQGLMVFIAESIPRLGPERLFGDAMAEAKALSSQERELIKSFTDDAVVARQVK